VFARVLIARFKNTLGEYVGFLRVWKGFFAAVLSVVKPEMF
jgi:hypothetical protein